MGNRKMVGLIGSPIEHSLSPLMHNTMFEEMKEPYYYQAFNVRKDHLKQAVEGMKALGFIGFNVTIPHKVNVMKYLDGISEEAKRIGAVNTVVLEDGKFIGYNTDGKGFVYSLVAEQGKSLMNKRVLIIGAGGAARGIYAALSELNLEIDISNRTIEKAIDLVNNFGLNTKVVTNEAAEEHLFEYDIIINTTSVGMSPHVEEIPLNLDYLGKHTLLCDIVYNPLLTKWLKLGQANGNPILTGVGMFVGQGALAFEKWTGKEPDYETMKNVVTAKLGG